jgi:outer membrane scaffolding protein for murein synthesis (MipA/OmpV family)
MIRLHAALLLCASLSCAAQGTAAPPDLPLPESAEPTPKPASPTVWEGAIGANLSYRPEYQGGDKRITKISPALFLRYGRFTITNASGFVTRRADDVVRGLGVDMLRSERLRVNLALRFDAGRSEGTSDALNGLGDIRPTVRARLTANWRGDDGLRLGAAWSVDAFGRGGGNFGDVSIGWEQRFSASTTASVGAALSAAGDRYMQTYYGVNAAQSARSGYAVYEPGAGLRDVSLSANSRTEINADWVLLSGAGISRLLGPAADSPLTRQRNGWGVNLGLARRF